jgi:phenylalanyl-tRNA synthetase beta chain
MRVPISWLAEYVALKTATPQAVMAELVRVGLEEEGEHGGGVSGPVVVGEVLEFQDEPQANGKTIRWCQVRVAPEGSRAADGEGDVRGIVCGANNFSVGDRVVVSLPGAELPGGFQISARKTYGHISDGMIASSKELGLGDDHSGILVLSSLGIEAEVGADAVALLGLSDAAAEVNVTPDRGYCLSIRGIAREYSHATGAKFTDPVDKVRPQSVAGFKLSVVDDSPIHGVVGCERFVLVEVDNLDAAAPTPSWMSNRLRLAGMRSISIVVDVTNYVMLELGQPTHAYDADKLSGGITVRRAKPGEQLTTLDSKVRKLHTEDLLITDDSGPIGLAGVMGGESTEVSLNTKRVLIEGANFEPISISRSARRHKLVSEASKRFERGVDPAVAPIAAARVAQLLVELAGGVITGGGADFGSPSASPKIELALDYPTAVVGVAYSHEQVVKLLTEIGCEVSVTEGVAVVTPPSWRPDLRHKTDLVEEVARLAGYDEIPSRIPVAPPGRGLTSRQQLRRRTLNSLAASGWVEVLNYPFVSDQQNAMFNPGPAVRLENPIQSEAPELRRSLLPGLLSAAARNLSRGITDSSLFEEGSIFLSASGDVVSQLPVGNQRPSAQLLEKLMSSIPLQPRMLAGVSWGDRLTQAPGRAAVATGYAHAIDAVRLVLSSAAIEFSLEQAQLQGFHPGRGAKVLVGDLVVGKVGELHPEISEALHLPRVVAIFELDLDEVHAHAPALITAGELRVQPAATQDLSLLVDTEIPAETLKATVIEGAGELLEAIVLTDDYRGDNLPAGKKSITFSLRFRGERTLTQAEASAARDAAVALAAKRFNAELRA